MPDFENYSEEARQIELQIVRHAIALGIDWNNPAEVRSLAHDALTCHLSGTVPPHCRGGDMKSRARIEIFGLAQLMLKVMAQSAEDDIVTHGGPVWKSFARALWAEYTNRQPVDPAHPVTG